ncbi:MAG TPA: 2-amino-4-oxopentanoate thiolase subunit OrtA [bacterium]|nr:2-amino-4-oxopentanoate thiolase subunit OrtA [bacterium]
MVRKGQWVEIHRIMLQPPERACQVPKDTKQVPLEMFIKGFLLHDAEIGDIVNIETLTGRRVSGELVRENPGYRHDFGQPITELLEIGPKLRLLLKEGESCG